jgi:hypothetical protein
MQRNGKQYMKTCNIYHWRLDTGDRSLMETNEESVPSYVSSL